MNALLQVNYFAKKSYSFVIVLSENNNIVTLDLQGFVGHFVGQFKIAAHLVKYMWNVASGLWPTDCLVVRINWAVIFKVIIIWRLSVVKSINKKEYSKKIENAHHMQFYTAVWRLFLYWLQRQHGCQQVGKTLLRQLKLCAKLNFCPNMLRV